ncbi:MAG: thioredoxin family protein [Kiritimatiellae bacterium]|jgi:protein disulfide-isomerase|nr:thioredoxin family protein [Kiritimatiellia bacterium]
MKKLLTSVSIVILTSLAMQPTINAATVESAAVKTENISATSKKPLWQSDFEVAKAQAKESGKPIFALFTGSDWCSWCVSLHDEVLSKSEFLKYAADELVLFEADFPRKKKISSADKKQNQALAAKYGIRGFPTVLILDAEGGKLAETGYKAGGPKVYVDHVKSLLKSAK